MEGPAACKLSESIDLGGVPMDGGDVTGHPDFTEKVTVAWMYEDSERALM